jgi:membrane fusion protein (multidrug efflux system)
MMKNTMIACALLLVITCSRVWAQEPSVLIRQAKVVQQPISETLTVYGQVQADPDTVQTISLLHDGLVTRVAVVPGQRVKRGETLLELATSPGAHMDYLKARSAVDYAQSELARQQRLLKEQLTTNAQVEAARNALQDARAGLQALEAQGQNKTRDKVSSPAAGIITQLRAKQGDRLQAGAPVLEIAIGNRLVARLGVEPEDIRLLEPGAPVKIRSVFVPDYTADSQVRQIHAMINPATHLVDVLVPIPADETDQIVLGSSLSAEIQLNAHTGMTIPRSAVLQDEQGTYVFRVVGGTAQRVAVATGLESDQWIEITSGLKPDEAVVIVGNYELKDGMPVREGG